MKKAAWSAEGRASRPAGTSTTRTSSGRAARPGRSWPSPRSNLFQGGADKAAVAAAREEARAGREDVARFADGVALEVRQAYEEAATARARHATAVKALESARESERITDERFKSGVVKTIDLLDAATARREAETRELVARADAHATALRLAVKAGKAPETVVP